MVVWGYYRESGSLSSEGNAGVGEIGGCFLGCGVVSPPYDSVEAIYFSLVELMKEGVRKIGEPIIGIMANGCSMRFGEPGDAEISSLGRFVVEVNFLDGGGGEECISVLEEGMDGESDLGDEASLEGDVVAVCDGSIQEVGTIDVTGR